MENDFIELSGVKVHNLKNISVKIPKDKLVVICGISGSGKSSLAFDTIFQRGPAAVFGKLVVVRAAVFGRIEKTGCGKNQRVVAHDRGEPKNHLFQSAFHRGHAHRDLRLLALALFAYRHRALSKVRQTGNHANSESYGRTRIRHGDGI